MKSRSRTTIYRIFRASILPIVFGTLAATVPAQTAGSLNHREEGLLPAAVWTAAGYPGGIPDIASPVINVRDFGAAGDGVTDDTAAVQAAINAASNPSVVLLPAGTYRISAMVNLRTGVVLRGEGYRATHVHCTNATGCIGAAGSAGNFVSIQSGFAKGTSQLVVANASTFTAGGGGQIQQDDFEPPAAYWGAYYVGQMVKVVAVNGNTLTIDPPLLHDYSPGWNPRIRPVQFIRHTGIEDLHLKRFSSGTSSGESNIHFSRAAESWIRRVESEWTERYHVSVTESLQLEFRDSYFHDAESRGDGGEGYGISLAHLVTATLTENNIFSDLRHAMILQMGAVGNVFGYNYAQRNYSDDGWDKTAIALHGHYPTANLFEGNIVGWAGLDNVWGPNGPGNTFFRNRVVGTDRNQDFGVYRGIWFQGWRGAQYAVCNEINTIGAQRVSQDGLYVPEGANGNPAEVIQHANVIRGVLSLNPGWSTELPDSYYFSGKPGFFGTSAWPALGCDRPFGQGTIPALDRWESGNYIPGPDLFLVELMGIPRNSAIQLIWQPSFEPPAGMHWRVTLLPDGASTPDVFDSLPAEGRGILLQDLVNGVWYTITLDAMDGSIVLASDTQRTMPADKFVFLPLLLR